MGSGIAGVADVVLRVQTGQFDRDMVAAGRLYSEQTSKIDALNTKLAASYQRVGVAVQKYGTNSKEATNALLRTKQIEGQLASENERLASSTQRAGAAQRGFGRTSNNAEKDLGRLGRGAIAGSGIMRGLGRSVVYASGTFLGGYGLLFAIRSTVSAAAALDTSIGQTRGLVTRSGKSWDQYGHQILKVVDNQSKLGAFTRGELLQSFNRFFIATGDVTKSLTLNNLAMNVARQRHIDLASAQQLLIRLLAGSSRGMLQFGLSSIKVTTNVDRLKNSTRGYTQEELKRAEQLDKSASATANLKLVTDKFQGSLRAWSRTPEGIQARFNEALQRTKEVIGRALLPVVDEYLTKASDWLDKGKNQERVTKLVSSAARTLASVVKTVASVVGGLVSVWGRTVGKLLSVRDAVIGIGIAFTTYKIAKLVYGVTMAFKAMGLQVAASSALASGATEAEAAVTVASMTTMEAVTIGATTAIKAALVSTGIGALIVGIGIAAELVITHWSKVKKWFGELVGWVKGHLVPVLAVAFGPVGLIAAEIITHWKSLKSFFTGLIGWFRRNWEPVVAGIIGGPILLAAVEIVKHWRGIKSFFANLGHWLVRTFTDAFDAIKNGAVKWFNNTISWFRRFPERIKSIFSGAGQWLFNAGKQVIQGLWNGLKSTAGHVLHWVTGHAHDIINAFKTGFGIFSPSKKTRQMGLELGQGLIDGMRSKEPAVRGQVNRVRNIVGGLGGGNARKSAFNHGLAITSSFAAGLKAGIGRVLDAVASVGKAVDSFLGGLAGGGGGHGRGGKDNKAARTRQQREAAIKAANRAAEIGAPPPALQKALLKAEGPGGTKKELIAAEKAIFEYWQKLLGTPGISKKTWLLLAQQRNDAWSQYNSDAKQAQQDAKAKAKKAHDAAQKRYDQSVKAREADLKAAVTAASKRSAAAEAKALEALAAYYRGEAKDSKLTKAEREAYRAKASATEAKAVEVLLKHRESALKTAVTRALRTSGTDDDIAAMKKLAAFYKREAHNPKLTAAMRDAFKAKYEAEQNKIAQVKAKAKAQADQTKALQNTLIEDLVGFNSSFAPNVFQQKLVNGHYERTPGSSLPSPSNASATMTEPRHSRHGTRLGRSLAGAASGAHSGETTVNVHQYFKAPTTDRNREARYALIATKAAFD